MHGSEQRGQKVLLARQFAAVTYPFHGTQLIRCAIDRQFLRVTAESIAIVEGKYRSKWQDRARTQGQSNRVLLETMFPVLTPVRPHAHRDTNRL